MPIAAVPAYLGQDFKDASPGLRFGMYLALWGINRRTRGNLWTTYDIDHEIRGQRKEEREVKKENKVSALSEARTLTLRDRQTLAALAHRQRVSFSSNGPAAGRLCLEALATAPFTTGLGNEHPLENGFAFLNPYGLPYLPGSGVKGVLRQAARELAAGEWGDQHGWCTEDGFVLNLGNENLPFSAMDALFGLQSADGASQHLRGALTFWDVIPQIKGDSLAVDIMTPHQSHYYQQKRDTKAGDSTTPHDSGQPNPITFLTVPPGSGFTFHVQCDLAYLQRIAPELATEGRWKAMLEAAFAHAFTWLGFGAKTATGYGAMRIDEAAAARQEKLRLEAEEQARERAAAEARAAELGAMTPALRQVREFADECQARHQQHPIVRENPNGVWHGKARALAKAAHESPDWTAEEKAAAADAIEEWLPKLVKVDAKDERKKMKLSALRGLG